MVACAFCDLKEIKDAIIMETDDVFVSPSPFPSVANEIIIVPKNHYTIFEQLPKGVLSQMSMLTKYMSAALFDATSCSGTNIAVQNGSSAGQLIAHTSIRIMPRNTASEIDTGWEPINMEKEELEAVAQKIRIALQSLDANSVIEEKGIANKPMLVREDKKAEEPTKPQESSYKKEIKSLRRHWEEDDMMKRQLFRNP